jgi:hypothetical protein
MIERPLLRQWPALRLTDPPADFWTSASGRPASCSPSVGRSLRPSACRLRNPDRQVRILPHAPCNVCKCVGSRRPSDSGAQARAPAAVRCRSRLGFAGVVRPGRPVALPCAAVGLSTLLIYLPLRVEYRFWQPVDTAPTRECRIGRPSAPVSVFSEIAQVARKRP